jgi:hypothetical protein
MGTSILALHAETADAVARLLEVDRIEGMASRGELSDAFSALAEANSSFFNEGEVVSLPLGMQDLLEGQARVSEIQYRDLAHKDLPWEEANSAGWLEGIYGQAYRVFLQVTGMAPPRSPLEDQVWLFLLLCDIALNPDQGYAFKVEIDDAFPAVVHPGIRFVRLCKAVARDHSIANRVADLSIDAYQSVTAALCDQLGWRSPNAIHRHVVASLGNVEKFRNTRDDVRAGRWDHHHLPFRLYLCLHEQMLNERIERPHYFCWIANYLSLSNKASMGREADIREWLDRNLPPFEMPLGGSLSEIAVSRPDLSRDQEERLISIYFSSLAVTDLQRQWLARSGNMVLSFSWQAQLTPELEEDIRATFERNFGVSINALRVP